MEKKYNLGRDFGVNIAVILCSLSVIILTCIGVVGKWPGYFYSVIWIQLFAIICVTLNKKIPVKMQGIVLGVCAWITVFLAGQHLKNYYLDLLMLCGVIVLVSFYHSRLLIIFETVLGILGIVLHYFLCDLIVFNTTIDYKEFAFGVFLFASISVSLYWNIYRDDIAKEKLKEAALDAEASEHAKSDFLANMSHEIRTPMNAIIGRCELVLRETNLSKTVEQYCCQIQNSGRSLLAIINDILDFSKIESGKMSLSEDEFNLASTLNDVINTTMVRLEDKPIELIVQVDPGIPKALLGDEIRIRQIMINLLSNAVKYTEEGVITLNVSKTVREYGINLVVSVKDTGIGISQKNMEKLFNSFQQVDTKKNRAVEGTGLGLVITKRLVTMMGGFIMVKSEYGVGSEFKFVIPMKVKDNKPFIKINESEKINAVCYIETDKFENEETRKAYKAFLNRIGESIQVKYYIFNNFEQTKKRLDAGAITHCFVGKEEFVKHSEYFSGVADKVSVVIVQNQRNAVVVPANMRCVYKPIYELPLASVFNNEDSIINLAEEKKCSNTFIAPKARVLIVDDNVVNLQVAVGLMQPYKMQILTVSSGKDAIRILGSKDYDIVFMDHMMPEMDGVEATQIIRSKPDEYYKKVPIIALTANAVSGAREMFMANGFNGVVTKPIELSALDRMLKNNLPSDKIEKNIVTEKSNTDTQELKVDNNTSGYIDVNVGLSYIGNNIDTYLAILNSYVEKGREKIKQISQLYADEEWKNYTIEVHALKSSSLSIGAKELSEKAKNLEMSGKANDITYIRKNHDDMMMLYAMILQVGEEILAENKKEEQTENKKEMIVLETAELKDLVEKIKTAIDNFDTDMLNEVTNGFTGAFYNGKNVGKEIAFICEAANDFDYEKAEKITQTLISEIGL